MFLSKFHSYINFKINGSSTSVAYNNRLKLICNKSRVEFPIASIVGQFAFREVDKAVARELFAVGRTCWHVRSAFTQAVCFDVDGEGRGLPARQRVPCHVGGKLVARVCILVRRLVETGPTSTC